MAALSRILREKFDIHRVPFADCVPRRWRHGELRAALLVIRDLKGQEGSNEKENEMLTHWRVNTSSGVSSGWLSGAGHVL
jgi:hypothetical protein